MIASVCSRPGRRPDPALHDLWHKRLDRFETSGLSAAAFCAAEGLSVHSFYAWRRRLRQHHNPRPPRRPPASAASPPDRLCLPR